MIEECIFIFFWKVVETLGKLDYKCSAIGQSFALLVPEVLLRKMKWQAFEREAKGDFGL